MRYQSGGDFPPIIIDGVYIVPGIIIGSLIPEELG